ncbi:Rieske 2Fe-2S family protein/choline monooxygenase [Arboricoccus pini]|uniref:Rieske 2Fe-2S family protein/choline monooxygenase n=1 Tax=Arboricoccus pini TaxID=1963835 RepID=A0A212S2Q3_9PROT|nr:aromatic ring-hydroxylating dioxygenase subunit alpha [Arboricoccus pini]SNB79406.1 Rieske 2Fe-2S family protein/choline monooxygenase [Arboricoccus pini]
MAAPSASNASGLEWTLPASMYRDPELYAREQQQIFARNWMLFSWSERLPKQGDYVTGTLAGYPIFVIRDDAGKVRAFHNVCRHRGARLLTEESGHCAKRVTCPYHSWTYGRDGRLAKATDFGGEVQFDAEAWSLYELDAEEWRGLVFLRLTRGGPSLIDWLGPIHTMAADYPLDQQHYFMSKDRDCDVDWKTYGENYLECYHCRTMHPGLCLAMDIEQYRVDVHQEQKFFHLHAPRREGGLTRGLYFYRFPFLMLNLYDWGSSIATIEPLGPGRIRHINWYFFNDVSPAKAQENRRSAEWSAQIITEDLDIITGVQANLNAGIYERGPLSPRYEASVKAFQAMVMDELEPKPAWPIAAE